MAVTQTGAIYKSLTFDNKTSREYGVYITGEAVYNAPKRAVEMISIPGRNGAFALDKGRFENIEVSYPAGIFAETESDFAQAVSDFRNYLCSRKGYCRLTDEYNPSEYRMAVYKSGLEVDPAQLRAGEFKITFECKPQRFLTSGETATAVASGGTVTNPTLFNASPLLEIEGSGAITFNGYEINIGSVILGNVVLPITKNGSTYTLGINSQLNSGDVITVSGISNSSKRNYANTVRYQKCVAISTSGVPGTSLSLSAITDGQYFKIATSIPSITFNYGISKTETITNTATVRLMVSGVTNDYSVTEQIAIAYNGSNTITISYTNTDAYTPTSITQEDSIDSATGYSTISLVSGSIYCDCDLGEFYRIENGEYISMNHIGDLGADLPKLAPGSNTITYDNTITTFKLTPRWWKV